MDIVPQLDPDSVGVVVALTSSDMIDPIPAPTTIEPAANSPAFVF